MPEHNALTGSQLHEPKGADSAASGTVYVSDGAGSGTWTNPSSDYGSIYTQESDTVSISSIGTTTQTLAFANDGPDNIVVADSANNRITCTNAGKYFVTFNISFSTTAAGDAGLYEFKVVDDGTPTRLAAAREMSGSSDTGSTSVAGIIEIGAGSQLTVEVESDNGSDTDDIDIYTSEFTVFYLGA